MPQLTYDKRYWITKAPNLWLQFDFCNRPLNASSRSEKKMIVFLFQMKLQKKQTEREVGILISLSVLRGFTQLQISRNYEGQKLDVPKSYRIDRNHMAPPELAICSKQKLFLSDNFMNSKTKQRPKISVLLDQYIIPRNKTIFKIKYRYISIDVIQHLRRAYYIQMCILYTYVHMYVKS